MEEEGEEIITTGIIKDECMSECMLKTGIAPILSTH